jgi:hypothetical protein
MDGCFAVPAGGVGCAPEVGAMTQSTPAPPGLDAAALTPVVRRLLGSRTAEVLDWECRPLGYAQVWQTTGGVHRVLGTAVDRGVRSPWSLILKIASAPPPGSTGFLAGTAEPGSTDYWKREAELFRDGVLDAVRGAFAPPACYGVVEPDPGAAWIWLEEVEEAVGPVWPLERFALAAQHLAQFNGRYLVGEPVPEHPSFCRPNYVRPHVAATCAERTVALAPAVWAEPAVRAVFPADAEARYRRLWDEQAVLLDLIDRLPRVFCHRDAFRNNLIARRTPDGAERTAAIDWALAGPGHLGEDLFKLVNVTLAITAVPFGPAELEAAAFDGYLAGLRDAGWTGDARLVRLGYCATAAVMMVPPFLGLRLVREPAFAEAWARARARPAEEVRDRFVSVCRLLLERAEEARALAPVLDA